MALIETITDESHFYQWLKRSDSYKDNFSYKGANALQEYIDNLGDDLNGQQEFDPVAWCVEYTEYKDMQDFWNSTNYTQEDYSDLESLRDNTTVIEFDGGFIVADF